jgi:hypothetical protein
LALSWIDIVLLLFRIAWAVLGLALAVVRGLLNLVLMALNAIKVRRRGGVQSSADRAEDAAVAKLSDVEPAPWGMS